jgi:hypothetical protein
MQQLGAAVPRRTRTLLHRWRSAPRDIYIAPKKLLAPAVNGTSVSLMAGQGSAGNVIAALCSFFVPGLGQLIQGRLLMAIIMFVLAAVLWFVLLGWIIHLWSILDAALFRPKL